MTSFLAGFTGRVGVILAGARRRRLDQDLRDLAHVNVAEIQRATAAWPGHGPCPYQPNVLAAHRVIACEVPCPVCACPIITGRAHLPCDPAIHPTVPQLRSVQ